MMKIRHTKTQIREVYWVWCPITAHNHHLENTQKNWKKKAEKRKSQTNFFLEISKLKNWKLKNWKTKIANSPLSRFFFFYKKTFWFDKKTMVEPGVRRSRRSRSSNGFEHGAAARPDLPLKFRYFYCGHGWAFAASSVCIGVMEIFIWFPPASAWSIPVMRWVGYVGGRRNTRYCQVKSSSGATRRIVFIYLK